MKYTNDETLDAALFIDTDLELYRKVVGRAKWAATFSYSLDDAVNITAQILRNEFIPNPADKIDYMQLAEKYINA